MLRFLHNKASGLHTASENRRWLSSVEDHYLQLFNIIEANADDTTALEAWLNAGNTPNISKTLEDPTGSYMTCPLLEAIRLKHEPMVRVLLASGADLNLLSPHGIKLEEAAETSGSMGVVAVVRAHIQDRDVEEVYQEIRSDSLLHLRTCNWPPRTPNAPRPSP